jgi:signal peptidase I
MSDTEKKKQPLCLVRLFRAKGASMAPFLRDGQCVLAEGITYRLAEPKRGDIVIFRSMEAHNHSFIKRIVGVPRDHVTLVDGEVFINGERLEEPFVNERGHITWGPRTIEEGCYFVLGDNRRHSNDSLYWGMLPLKNIIGKVVCRIPIRQDTIV